MGVLRVRDGGSWVDIDTSGNWVPIGVIMMFGGPTAPSGFLPCNGNLVSRTTYAQLFSAIGTTWGAGDGTTTFALPNLLGRVGVGAGAGAGLTNRVLGTTFGEETHLLTAAESGMPAHTPSVSTMGTESADHSHSGSTGTVSADHTHVAAAGYNILVQVGSPSTWNFGDGISGGSVYVLYASYAGPTTGGISANHTHAFTSGGRSAGHTHGVTMNAVAAANAAGAHNNMQPTAVINYIIRVS